MYTYFFLLLHLFFFFGIIMFVQELLWTLFICSSLSVQKACLFIDEDDLISGIMMLIIEMDWIGTAAWKRCTHNLLHAHFAAFWITPWNSNN